MALRIVDNSAPGYRRQRHGDVWRYFTETGRLVTSAALIDRLNKIALPPAYTDAWFAKHRDAHIQATGIDARGRKQYRYHPAFREMQEDAKFRQCLAFGLALRQIRKQVDQDLRQPGITRERVIAAVVRLLDIGALRIGNAGYAKANGSFGATTLRNRHAKVQGAKVRLNFIGKSGKQHSISIQDRRLARVVQRCQDLPGQQLFQYDDGMGAMRPVTSDDINAYLAALGPFTAKHFRTWAASVIALDFLLSSGNDASLAAMLTAVSQHLGNTPAIARKSYIHPAIIDIARGDAALPAMRCRATPWYSRTERALLSLLDQAC